eukprot:TRINITY_DN847_c0_g1_i1.p1 TRINITY_DN847_c0_g1~~TRINITY_DN847_c0_g1_i1.p1  ORF type:complete len:120 (+),score=18.66 TRINITY_DN847_c0_g1_i1:105-464(+)
MEDLREFDPLQQRKKGKHSVEHGAVKTPKPETFEHVIDDHQHDASHSFYDYDSMLERLFEVFEEITVDCKSKSHIFFSKSKDRWHKNDRTTTNWKNWKKGDMDKLPKNMQNNRQRNSTR